MPRRRSTLNETRRDLFLAQRTLGDINAIKRGRFGQRLFNRIVGRQVNRAMRKVWR